MIDLSETDLLLFQEFFSRESGIYFDKDKSHNLQHALFERMQRLRIKSCHDYYNFLMDTPRGESETEELLNLVTIGETYFFRNLPQFEVLRESVLPEIIGRKGQDKNLRVWSAGCSSGAEPYSLAMIIREVLPDYKDWQISILATDINKNVLSFAREAIYKDRDIAHLPQGYLERYFKKDGKRYILSEDVKELVSFSRHNLAKDTCPLQDIDIIFCRNVIIYFDEATIKRVIDNFYRCLKTGGYLFLGHSEILWQINDKFKTMEFPRTFIYQKTPYSLKEESHPFISIPEIKFEEFVDTPELDKTAAHTDFQRATELANQGDYQEAMDQLKKIIHRDNLHVEAYYLLGVLAYRTGNFEEAREQFKKVIYIDHNVELAYFNLANIYLCQKKYVKAARELKSTIKLLEEKSQDDFIKFSEDLSVDFLLAACKNSLNQIKERMIV